MLRFALLVALAFTASVGAAPVPPPSEKELLAKYWGKTEGQGEFELSGKRLTLRTTGQPADGFIGVINGSTISMPRATRTVTGDFEATVTVADAEPPNKDARHTAAWPNTRAGVFVSGNGYAIELHLNQYYTKFPGGVNDELTRCVWVDAWFPGGGVGSSLQSAEAGKSTHLRITRKDNMVTVSHSFDGKEWSAPRNPRQGMAFPDEVTVGVFFGHSTYQTLAATFDAFTVEKPKATK